MGMINQLGKFSSRLAELSQPLRELLSTKRSWTWGPNQDQAFSELKAEITRPTVLALYDPQAETKISADASSFGLGAVLLQQTRDSWRPVAYASRSMSETEKRYAQIEKEALATTWACEKFSDYILGKHFQIESDHKPLIPILSTKHLDNLPPRVLRFRLRMAKFSYTIHHVPGKLLYTADTLSRAPATTTNHGTDLPDEVETFINSIIANLPASEQRLEVYRQAQLKDTTCKQAMDYCQSGWPKKQSAVSSDLLPYWSARTSLTIHNNLLLYDHRIVVPPSLQSETLQRIHEGHQGITKCHMRARSSVWWPKISQHITQVVQKCPVCAKEAFNSSEPLITTPLPEYPWQVVGTDLFKLKNEHYLLIVDYFSRYPEVIKLVSTTSASIIKVLQEFTEFAKSYGFTHTTSSARYPQSNGQAERMVQTVKRMLKRSKDPHMALLSYRATPMPWCNLSPAELLMGRRIRTPIPQTDEQMTPSWPYLEEFQKLNREFKARQKQDFDRCHRARELPSIPEDTEVWITSDGEQRRGKVITHSDTPRSYLVDTPTGVIRRNRRHLNILPNNSEPEPQPDVNDTPQEPSPEISLQEPSREISRRITRSQSGVVLKPPERLA